MALGASKDIAGGGNRALAGNEEITVSQLLMGGLVAGVTGVQYFRDLLTL